MSTARPEMIECDNISELWAQAFLTLMAPGASPRPLLLSLTGMVDSVPQEIAQIRTAVDEHLRKTGNLSCKITANTIFPYERWRRNHAAPRSALYDWYLNSFLPRAKARDSKNCYGTYFERMIRSTGAGPGHENGRISTKNQLEHIITIWLNGIRKGHRPRRSALQLVCFDPSKDHTRQPVRGFPCLQQVGFSYDVVDEISVTAYYPTQYIFDRAYGNYLGLCQLGEFVADAVDSEVVRFNCLILQPELGSSTKSALRPLETEVRNLISP